MLFPVEAKDTVFRLWVWAQQPGVTWDTASDGSVCVHLHVAGTTVSGRCLLVL